MTMETFPFLLALPLRPLSRCSLPFATSAVSVRSQFFSSEHSVLLLPEGFPLKRRMNGFHFAKGRGQHLFLTRFGTSSCESTVRKISNLQTGDGPHKGAPSASRSRIARVTEPESGKLQIQLLGRAQSSTRLQVAAPKASRSDGVEFVLEEAEIESGSTDEGESKDSTLVLMEADVSILAQYMTRHNFVRVLEVSRSANNVLAGARVLLLDKPGNVHSIYQKYRLLTESYYDICAALPAVIPEGPIGILGLGAGTAARLIHHFWPEIDMHGWELDSGVIQAARNFFDLQELEWKDGRDANEDNSAPVRRRRNSSGSYCAWKDESDEIRLNLFQVTQTAPRDQHGKLRVHVGDALRPNATVEAGFAGLIVDLFAEGAVIPALQQVETWREMTHKLRPGGRIMVNCGGSCVEAAGVDKKDGGITMRETVAALAEAFPGELSITSLRDHGDNSIALTGPIPNFQVWQDTLPECLRRGMEGWRVFSSS